MSIIIQNIKVPIALRSFVFCFHGVLLAGRNANAFAQVIEDEKAVSQNLFDYYLKSPQAAKYVHIGLDAAGQPVRSDCDHAAQSMVMVKINVT